MATRLSAYRPAAPASLDRRGAARRSVLVTSVEVGTFAEAPAAAELGDLSAYGCRIGSAGERRAGERVRLALAGAPPVAATVVWADADTAGCRFDEPLPRELVRALALGIG